MPIENTSDTQCPDAGYSCLLSDCRTAVVPHLVVQHLGKMYATKPPLGSLQPCIFPAYTFPIGILDYIFLVIYTPFPDFSFKGLCHRSKVLPVEHFRFASCYVDFFRN